MQASSAVDIDTSGRSKLHLATDWHLWRSPPQATTGSRENLRISGLTTLMPLEPLQDVIITYCHYPMVSSGLLKMCAPDWLLQGSSGVLPSILSHSVGEDKAVKHGIDDEGHSQVILMKSICQIVCLLQNTATVSLMPRIIFDAAKAKVLVAANKGQPR